MPPPVRRETGSGRDREASAAGRGAAGSASAVRARSAAGFQSLWLPAWLLPPARAPMRRSCICAAIRTRWRTGRLWSLRSPCGPGRWAFPSASRTPTTRARSPWCGRSRRRWTRSVCLDVGHLHERLYPARGLRRKLLVANDRFSPRPFACPARLPAGARGLGARAGRGRRTARVGAPARSRRPPRPPAARRGPDRLDAARRQARNPVVACRSILETDHRDRDPESVRADLRRLKELLAG